MDVEILTNVTVPEQPFRFALSAFIGVISAFIGVPGIFVRITRYRPLNEGFSFARNAALPILKSSVP